MISSRQRRNKLLGMWAAEKLGITGGDAEAYSDALAMGTLDHEHNDVFSKIRKDFDAAGVTPSSASTKWKLISRKSFLYVYCANLCNR